MPCYTYRNTVTDEYVDIVQGMNDVHEYKGEDGTETVWERVFYSPCAAIDTQIDPYNPADFVNKTGAKKGNYGNLLDASKELSEKRAQRTGKDPVQQQHFKEYKDKRRGLEHPEEKKQRKIETANATISFN